MSMLSGIEVYIYGCGFSLTFGSASPPPLDTASRGGQGLARRRRDLSSIVHPLHALLDPNSILVLLPQAQLHLARQYARTLPPSRHRALPHPYPDVHSLLTRHYPVEI